MIVFCLLTVDTPLVSLVAVHIHGGTILLLSLSSMHIHRGTISLLSLCTYAVVPFDCSVNRSSSDEKRKNSIDCMLNRTNNVYWPRHERVKNKSIDANKKFAGKWKIKM